jgi:D-glycero-alpha-D-manno-heptose 1-phosphate guanylyltransferase
LHREFLLPFLCQANWTHRRYPGQQTGSFSQKSWEPCSSGSGQWAESRRRIGTQTENLMDTKEAIILAGGLGTRLRSAVPDMPKCMAPVAGNPFLHYVITYFQKQGISKFIFSLGHKHEIIKQWLDQALSPADYDLSIEKEPLGTGGAIKLACRMLTGDPALIINGDTLFKINVNQLSAFHSTHQADCTLCLKPMSDFDRYGAVELDSNDSITRFYEKRFLKTGLINGGVYALNVANFLKKDLPEIFSFEQGYLEKLHWPDKLFGLVQDEYFIDIGVPEDYERAQSEMKNER